MFAGAGQYKSKKLNSLAYILFSPGRHWVVHRFFADPNGWAQTMLGNGTEQSYIDTMQATANHRHPDCHVCSRYHYIGNQCLCRLQNAEKAV